MRLCTGILTNPMGNPMKGAVIRLVSASTAGTAVKGTYAETITSDTGAYSFNVVDGVFEVYLRQCKELMLLGKIDTQGFSTADTTLENLLIGAVLP